MLSPITQKRLKRFKEKKRSYWSLKLLVALYLISLPAELICNNKPLYVKHKGASYFPVFKFYPESSFVDGGKQARADYKKLNGSSDFTDNKDNYMIFPLVPHGPYESLDPESLRQEEQVTLTLIADRYVGSVDVDSELTIVKSLSAGPLFGSKETDVTGRKFSDTWDVGAKFTSAIVRRLNNEKSPSSSVTLDHDDPSVGKVIISLSRFASRSQQPDTVRIMMRQSKDSLPETRKITFNRTAVTEDKSDLWKELNADARATLRAAADNGFEQEYIDAFKLHALGAKYRVRTARNDVQWPHPPARSHLLGIDSTGRDVFARIFYGLRTSMTFALILVVLSMTIGITMGSIQGFFGGWVDITSQRFIEIWSAMPFLYIMILMGSIYGPSFGLLIFCYAIFNWIGISYYMRAEFLRLRKQQFVDAAKCMGVPAGRIMFKHILPNAITPIITLFPFSLVGAIGALAALDYLGFGLPSPTPSWGELFQQAQQFRWAWWLILYPFLSMFTVMILGVFIGEGVRDAFDPRPFSKME